MVYANPMPYEECPHCTGHQKLDCIRDTFASKLAKLLHDTLDEVPAEVPEEQPEISERKAHFPTELADHLLWLAASVYVGEGVLGSEAIYELAKAIEEVGSEPDEDPTEADPQGPRFVSEHDVN
jgi:hypothetical protein